jgi:hypothetical protein
MEDKTVSYIVHEGAMARGAKPERTDLYQVGGVLHHFKSDGSARKGYRLFRGGV